MLDIRCDHKISWKTRGGINRKHYCPLGPSRRHNMIPYKKEKIENAICFFAQEHKKKSGKPLAQTYLWKYLAFVDFISTEKLGSPAFGLEYKAMGKGPVPHSLYNRRHDYKTDLFEFINIGEGKFIIRSKKAPDTDYFSKFEMSLMDILICKYAQKWAKDISEDSHNRIRAYKKTATNEIMDYALTFEGNIRKKDENFINQAEAHFVTDLLFRGPSKCGPVR